MNITCLIIDDEQPSRENLNAILGTYFPSVTVLGMVSSTGEALAGISELNPDVLFLDIELGTQNGLHFLHQFESPSFEVIFITAYDAYAVKAFKTIASDYLLKPIDIEELRAALEKIQNKIADRRAKLSAKEQSATPVKKEKLKVATSDGTELIPYDQILYLQSINYYTNIVLSSGKEIITSRHLKDYEAALTDSRFFRIHNSFVVNVEKIRSMHHKDGGHVVLLNGKEIKISRRRKEGFVHFVNTYPGISV